MAKEGNGDPYKGPMYENANETNGKVAGPKGGKSAPDPLGYLKKGSK